MNVLLEPGFELGGVRWTLTSPAAVVDSGARTGRRALWLAVARYEIDGPLYRGEARQVRPTLPGERYRASVWVRPSGDPECAVRLYVASPSTAAPVLLAELGPGAEDRWQQIDGEYVAAGPDSAVILAVREQPDIGAWLLDDAALELEMPSRRNEIRQALLSVLAGIDGPPDYETTPARVVGYAREPVDFPEIQVADDEESREIRGYRAVRGRITFQVALFSARADDEDKVQEIDQLVSDVERAIGQDPRLGLPSEYGVNAVVRDINVWRGLPGDMGSGAVVTVEVEYRFASGNP